MATGNPNPKHKTDSNRGRKKRAGFVTIAIETALVVCRYFKYKYAISVYRYRGVYMNMSGMGVVPCKPNRDFKVRAGV